MEDGCEKGVENTEAQIPAVVSGESQWNASPLFNSGGYTMIGEEGRIGFIYDDTDVTRFTPDKVNKYMWHFWGNDDELDGALKITATHENSSEAIILFEDLPKGGENNGANQHAPSNFSLPEVGIWRLDAFFGNELFGSIFVEVYEE